MSTKYRSLPDARTGYALDESGGFWSVIVPQETTNLILDPTNELETGYIPGGGVGAVDTTTQAFGKASYRIDPGVFNAIIQSTYTVSISAGPHTFSVYVKAAPDVRFNLNVTPAQGLPPANQYAVSRTYYGTGAWTQYSVSWNQLSSANVYLSIYLLNEGETHSLYTDAWQLEALAYPTTFCSGDLRGHSHLPWLQEYRWNGTPYYSTSTRSGLTRSGGRVVNLRDEAFFHTTDISGAGIGEFEIYTTSLATGQTLYNGAQAKGRDLAITGVLYGDSYQQLQVRRRKLIELFRPDATPDKQPVLLQYQPIDGKGMPYGAPLLIPVVYTGGLQGKIDNHYRETLTLTLRAYDDWRTATVKSNALTVSPEITFTSMALRDEDTWLPGAPDVPATTVDVYASAWHESNKLFVAGNSLTLGVTGGLVTYTDETWAESFEVSGPVYGISKLYGFYNNHIGIVGNFAFVDGDAHPNAVLLNVDTNALVDIVDPDFFDAAVRTIASTSTGVLYIGGEFTTPGNRIIRWNPYSGGGAFETIGNGYASDGVSGPVYAVAVGPDGNIYLGGSYISEPAGEVQNISKYLPSSDTYEAIDEGLNNPVRAMVFTKNGTLYVGGAFTQGALFNTRPIRYLAQYNGRILEEIPGLNGTVYALAVDSKGNLHVGGDFTDNPAGDSYYGVWNGASWINADINIPRGVRTISIGPDDSVFIGTVFDGSVTAYTPSTDTIAYDGTTESKPQLIFENMGYLEQVTNLTTGTSIYFKDLYIANYEKAILDLTPGNIRFWSNARSNLMNYVSPTSDIANWRLMPGENKIMSYYWSTGVTTNIIVSSPDKHHSFDIAGELT